MSIFKHIFGKKKYDETREPSVKDTASVRPDAEKSAEELQQEAKKLQDKIIRTEAYLQKALDAGHEKDAARFREKKAEQEARLEEIRKLL